MDVYEATRIVLSRIQSLDPTNASKIMGLLLLQDHEEKEMIRLAFGPQNLLHSVIAKAKTELGLMASTLTFELEDRLSFLESDFGFGCGQCSYLCNCKFVYARVDGSRIECNELLRLSFSILPKRCQLAAGAASLMMGDDLHKLGRWRQERTDLSAMACPASRQIYLIFPADSLFGEEDVSDYFSTYGPVQDVRIPYQQKRMFGFVTFVYIETVNSILAKGNPHFVCDSRVLVKPYKEKGRVPEKYRTKPSPDGSPTGLDSRDIMDLQLGGRAFHDNTQDLLWKRRFEERALELQSRRLMNLQLLDVKKLSFDQTLVSPRLDKSLILAISINQRENGREDSDEDTIKLPERLEDRLPDNPFASPTYHFHTAAADTNGSGPSCDHHESKTTSSDSFKSFNCQMPSLPGMGGMLPGPVCGVGI